MKPSSMTEQEFIERFGGVYEHSSWVAKTAWQMTADKTAFDRAESLADILSTAMNGADQTAKLALIRAHPDLAGKAAIGGTLTPESTKEQKGAGLDQCTQAEFDALSWLNGTYTDKFGLPFIIAVKGHNVGSILQAFETRLCHYPGQEMAEALRQIDRIARFRIEVLFK